MHAEITINKSDANNAEPIFNFVYFRRIMAMISVPPLDASILKKIAELTAGNATAKINSNNGSSVSGAAIG